MRCCPAKTQVFEPRSLEKIPLQPLERPGPGGGQTGRGCYTNHRKPVMAKGPMGAPECPYRKSRPQTVKRRTVAGAQTRGEGEGGGEGKSPGPETGEGDGQQGTTAHDSTRSAPHGRAIPP